ncbi:unnamed protein product [Penicillium nalgiovense]|nr:unnamed protein product [Penicillium nalgiovense]
MLRKYTPTLALAPTLFVEIRRTFLRSPYVIKRRHFNSTYGTEFLAADSSMQLAIPIESFGFLVFCVPRPHCSISAH